MWECMLFNKCIYVYFKLEQQQLINLLSIIKLIANYADNGLIGNEQSHFYFYFLIPAF